MATYEIRGMVAADKPLIQLWLSQPHVRQWWADSAGFDFTSNDLSHPNRAQFIISLASTPFAYLQCCPLSEWDAAYGPQPSGSRGIDQLIGVRELVGRGHGSAFIRQFCDQLFEKNIPKVLVDPDPRNTRAIRAYEKAGFRHVRKIRTPDGDAIMMEREP